MKIEISEFAQNELQDALLYYELQQYGLGVTFKNAVKEAIGRIKKYPTSWPVELGKVRKCFVHKFPYKILYSVQQESIVILAIAHQHRKPGYWIEGT